MVSDTYRNYNMPDCSLDRVYLYAGNYFLVGKVNYSHKFCELNKRVIGKQVIQNKLSQHERLIFTCMMNNRISNLMPISYNYVNDAINLNYVLCYRFLKQSLG